MGCISSKIITRSRSYQEELNKRFQNRDNNDNNTNNNGLNGLEELFISRNGGAGRDQFLAHLVCSAAAAAASNSSTHVKIKKLQTGKFSTSKQQPSNKDITGPSDSAFPMNLGDETITSWELMAGLEEQEEKQPEQQQQQILLSQIGELEPINHHQITKKRSKSFHWFVEQDLSSSTLEGSYSREKDRGINDTTTTTKNNNHNNKMGIPRSRSFHFHTLQEYDEMVVERNKWLIEATEQGTVLDSIEGKDNKHDGLMEEDAIKEDNRWIEKDPTPASKEAADKSKSAEIIETNNEYNAFTAYSIRSSISATDVVEDAPSKGNLLTSEKGLRRKALAKELTSLSIPMPQSSTIEFLAGLKERLDHDEVLRGEQQVYSYYSSEAYVTPKFGSFYSLPPVPVQRKKCSSGTSVDDSAVFESEMVAAFEEAMQHLQIEEDCVLKQIGENTEISYESCV